MVHMERPSPSTVPCWCPEDWSLMATVYPAGKMTVNTRFGTKVAVLAGDFLFAQSSWFLANLDNLEVKYNLHPLSAAASLACPSIV